MQQPAKPEFIRAEKGEGDAELDAHLFRQALAQFATGITIITTKNADGKYVGVTANSFNSVSLHPPLVLWSLSKKASSHDAFAAATHYGVSVLSADQEDLSHHFSTFKGDRFAGVEVIEGLGGAPLIPNALAHFECKMRSRYDEGDHFIMVGEVLRCDFREGEALVYRSRKYFRN
ncbi:MAG: flavin reductase family protein [Burkholderiales bacterium]|jgi:flavin reductase (DIM6/NTAB) family NADH-FMN oxidoreductase RutF|uniref:flavin reductase family protein n=1 Tax=Limnobacter sp. TaxID=2003368 RepID=UPI003938E4FC|nr:flavin reductase family protein [Burkholderiales bacterium]